MSTLISLKHSELDKEWVLLIQTAKMMGLSVEEVRLYIANRQLLSQRSEEHQTECLQNNTTQLLTT